MALNDDISLLSRLRPFAAFNDEALRLLAFSSDSRILRANDVLVRGGQKSDGGYLVRTGTLVLVTGRDKGEPTSVGPGELIGETALVTDVTFHATVIAGEACSILHIPRAAVQKVMQEYPGLAVTMRDDILARMNEVRNRMQHVHDLLEPPGRT
jgi:CRP-like cAMP-binding protein